MNTEKLSHPDNVIVGYPEMMSYDHSYAGRDVGGDVVWVLMIL